MLLIQLHMAALSLANITGNYDVLRAMGSPKFQAANTAADLAKTFQSFRANNIDVSPALLYAPVLNGPPRLEGADTLRLSGHFETEPQNVAFDLAFQAVNNGWRLAGISVQTMAARAVQTAAEPVREPVSKTPAAKTIGAAKKK